MNWGPGRADSLKKRLLVCGHLEGVEHRGVDATMAPLERHCVCDRGKTLPHFTVGDYVLVARVSRQGKHRKLMSTWIGPWRVANDDNAQVYAVQHLVTAGCIRVCALVLVDIRPSAGTVVMARRRSPVAVPGPVGDPSDAAASSQRGTAIGVAEAPSCPYPSSLHTGYIILLRRPPMNGFDFHEIAVSLMSLTTCCSLTDGGGDRS